MGFGKREKEAFVWVFTARARWATTCDSQDDFLSHDGRRQRADSVNSRLRGRTKQKGEDYDKLPDYPEKMSLATLVVWVE